MIEKTQKVTPALPPAMPEATIEAALVASFAALPHLAVLAVSVSAIYRHKKRGTEYELIGYGRMQAKGWKEDTDSILLKSGNRNFMRQHSIDMREVVIYRSATDPTEIWVRPREEFEDGRFEVLK